MARPKKDSEMFHCRIDRLISEALNKLCEETGLTKTKAVERALSTYIETYKKSGKS